MLAQAVDVVKWFMGNPEGTLECPRLDPQVLQESVYCMERMIISWMYVVVTGYGKDDQGNSDLKWVWRLLVYCVIDEMANSSLQDNKFHCTWLVCTARPAESKGYISLLNLCES